MSEASHIDWSSVRRRLEENQHSLETALVRSTAEVDSILARRAEVLARRPATLAQEASLRTLLLVEVGAKVAGLEVSWVQEVVNLAEAHSPIPEAHPSLLGVINVHNQIVNLISPWPLLNEAAPGSASAAFPKAVLLRHPHLAVAIACTQVLHLVELPESAWQSDRHFFHHPDQPPAVLLDISGLLASLERQEQKPL